MEELDNDAIFDLLVVIDGLKAFGLGAEVDSSLSLARMALGDLPGCKDKRTRASILRIVQSTLATAFAAQRRKNRALILGGC